MLARPTKETLLFQPGFLGLLLRQDDTVLTEVGLASDDNFLNHLFPQGDHCLRRAVGIPFRRIFLLAQRKWPIYEKSSQGWFWALDRTGVSRATMVSPGPHCPLCYYQAQPREINPEHGRRTNFARP